MCIFDLHTSNARYEPKVVLLHLWRLNVKTIRRFINIPLGDLSHVNLLHNIITCTILKAGRDGIIVVKGFEAHFAFKLICEVIF
jgi:hypothetical protein